MTFTIKEEDYLMHYGTPRHSGRYPWGSGENPFQNSVGFLGLVKELEDKGLSASEIADHFEITQTELKRQRSIAKNAKKQADVAMAQRLKKKHMSNGAIAERMGLAGESSVRALLAASEREDFDILNTTTQMLRDSIKEKQYIDIGVGVERHMGVSRDKLSTAVTALENEGYTRHYVKIPQLGTTHETSHMVLAAPGVEYMEVYNNREKIANPVGYSEDGGRSYFGIYDPVSVDSKRIQIRYKEDGGGEADGVVFVRPNVPDLDMGGNRYSQVRIAVDGTHYIKGMALLTNDIPDGVDLVVNSVKSDTGNKLDALKPMKKLKDGSIDPDNPFGSEINRQITARDSKGNEYATSAMNMVNEEGAWDDWNNNLSSQMLSKQPPKLAKDRLSAAYKMKREELDEILELTNPVVKKRLLDAFADGADSSSIHMKAAAMPGQATQVLLPINSLKETEVYAPNFTNGDRVALIRYPHGGIFEIPELTVNNRHPKAKAALGDAEDAIGINSKVAERLSGADFDGDTVLVIPNNDGKIRSAPAIKRLQEFDAKREYKAYDGMRTMDGGVWSDEKKAVDYGDKEPSSRNTGIEMGKISNLITDMTIRDANLDEITQAVRHAMVVIDAEKHHLDYRRSATDHGIPALKKKYQGAATAGASTLISQKKTDVYVPKRKDRPAGEGGPIDPDTGRRMYVPTGESYERDGQTIFKEEKVKLLSLKDSAHELSSGTKIESIYADHSDSMRALANEARRETLGLKGIPRSSSARVAYAEEVATLTADLNTALMNAPLERQAQRIGDSIYRARLKDNPNMSGAEKKKIKSQVLREARLRNGAAKARIDITPAQWEAIQAGAISPSMLSRILDNTDLDKIKEYATPRAQTGLSASKLSRARAMLAGGATYAEVARALGVSPSTLRTNLA